MLLSNRISTSIKGVVAPLIWFAFYVLVPYFSWAKEGESSGNVSGIVVDAEYGGSVPRAKVTVVETGQTSTSDMNGEFVIPGMSEGSYTLVVSAEFYKSSRVDELVVSGGEVARIDIPLYGDMSSTVELDEVVVTARSLAGSNLALLSQRQKASSISDAIGSESFGRLGVGDAADALSKTTGASIIDGKYVVIRGLSDRYNNTTLNGSTVPSADPDKRAVQLDQFPSGIIESIVTSKSFTPDKSGNFTGGSVDVVTKSVPDSYFMTVSIGVEYNEKSTFKEFLTYDGGDRDWLGMDDGTRQVPQVVIDAGSIPTNPVGRTQEELELMDKAVKAFDPQLAPYIDEAPLSHSASVAFGNRYSLGREGEGPVLGVIGSFNYKRKFSGYDNGLVGRYDLVGRDLSLGMTQRFDETKGTDEAQWGSILNAALAFGSDHEVGLKTMYNQSGEDVAIYRVGEYPETVGDSIFKVRNLHYTERTLSSYQVHGEHRFETWNGARFDWEVSTAKSVQEEPDFRLFYDDEPVSPDGRPSYTGNYPAPRRYWRDLDERTDEYKLNITLPIGQYANDIKFGIHSSETEREFNERSFNYQGSSSIAYDGDASRFLDESFLGLGPDGRMRRYIREFIGFVPRYTGKQEIDAAYLMADLRPLERWRVILGARYEEADIMVQSFQSNGLPFGSDGDLQDSDWLPAVQIVKELTPNQNLRIAYSRTLARPNFRELSPFGSFDNVGGEVFIGNSQLTRTMIENYDLRYEWFMEGSDIVAVSAFSKSMEDPIELVYSQGRLSYANVPNGELYGLEFEARKKIPFLSGERSELTIGGNVSFLESQVERSEQELADKLRRDPYASATREMQGQSSLIGNLDLLWSHFGSGSSYSLVYNHTGESLYSVSDSALPDIYQEPSDSLDLIYSQKLSNGFSMKLAIKNILDDDRARVWSDFAEELVYSQSSSGRSIALSFSKRFE